ncbi:hypothetical protein OZ13_05960 [Xanthomonas cannabis pv. cannabis]|nr:hypothetical protein OZ13_05960 [Xanthomonas cannabis pv. cannabis]KHL59339.1 hypothetical protein OZ10_02425 [Xanthomonas cannabis pv. cannabis]
MLSAAALADVASARTGSHASCASTLRCSRAIAPAGREAPLPPPATRVARVIALRDCRIGGIRLTAQFFRQAR